MSTKRPTAADDAYRVLSSLISALDHAAYAYDRDKNWESEHLLFIAGLNADEIERSYRRTIRKRHYLISGPCTLRDWVRLPENLDLGRKLVTEHRARKAQRENGDAA